MELNITKLMTMPGGFDPKKYSSSIAESGREDIGEVTWRAALKAPMVLETAAQIAAFKNYLKEFGACSDEEIDEYSDADCNALLVQMIAGEMRAGETHAFHFDKQSGQYYYFID